VLLEKRPTLKNALYNLFSGKPDQLTKQRYGGGIFIEKTDIIAQPVENNFFYLCHPDDIPGDMKVGQLVSMVHGLMGLTKDEKQDYYTRHDIKSISGKKFSKLDDVKKFEVLLSFLLLRKRTLYLINYITREMPIECYLLLKDVMEELAQKGSLVVYLTRDRLLSIPQPLETERDNIDYSELERWSEVVESHRHKE
jgi:ABC-type transport system involved in cytochrome c biogenesis ATPase subunit